MTHEIPRIEANDPVGLCAHCRHGRPVPTPRVTYWLCGRSFDEPAFDKYPRLPVRACPGFEMKSE